MGGNEGQRKSPYGLRELQLADTRVPALYMSLLYRCPLLEVSLQEFPTVDHDHSPSESLEQSLFPDDPKT